MRIPSNVQPLGAFQEDVISNLFPSWLPSYTRLSRVTFVTGSGFGKADTNKERHLIKLSERFFQNGTCKLILSTEWEVRMRAIAKFFFPYQPRPINNGNRNKRNWTTRSSVTN